MNRYECTTRAYTIEQVESEARADAISVLGTSDIEEVSRTPFRRRGGGLESTFVFQTRTEGRGLASVYVF